MENAEQIMKPMSVARAEFINSLTDLINNSMLPPFIIEPILKDMYNDIHMVAQRQYEADVKRYNEELKKQGEKKRPFVCRNLEIPCVDILGLCELEGWDF